MTDFELAVTLVACFVMVSVVVLLLNDVDSKQ